MGFSADMRASLLRLRPCAIFVHDHVVWRARHDPRGYALFSWLVPCPVSVRRPDVFRFVFP